MINALSSLLFCFLSVWHLQALSMLASMRGTARAISNDSKKKSFFHTLLKKVIHFPISNWDVTNQTLPGNGKMNKLVFNVISTFFFNSIIEDYKFSFN